MEAVIPQVMRMTHWVSVAAYAKASGIQVRSAYLRIKRGVVCHTKVASMEVIDIRLSPPTRKLPQKTAKAPTFRWDPRLPAREDLILTGTFCEQNNIRGHAFYSAILLGQVKAWVIADFVFVERGLDPTPFKRKPPSSRTKRRYTHYGRSRR